MLLMFSPYMWAQDAEFIWAEEDSSGSRILLSQHKNGSWQPAEKIIEDSKLNILPVIGSDTKGQRLVVWSTVEGADSVLKYSAKRGNRWSAPQTIPSQMTTNLAPVIIFDENDICWVFWSANDGDDDDIYVSKLAQGIWSKPEMVHKDNDTPDILPEAGQDDNGNIWVSWQQLREQGYVEVSTSFDSRGGRKLATNNSILAEEIKKLKVSSDIEQLIKPPSFHRSLGRASMYYPNNKNRPSRSVKGNLTQ